MRDCVLWSDGARIILLGLGNKKGDIEDMSFEQLDIFNVQNVWTTEFPLSPILSSAMPPYWIHLNNAELNTMALPSQEGLCAHVQVR